MTTRLWAILTIVLGLITLAIAIGFSYLPDVAAAYANGAFGPALASFQKAASMAELVAIFGQPADPAILNAMSAGNTLDLYGFIPAYTLFLIAGASMLAGGLNKPLALLSIVPTLIGAGADVVETWTQLQMTHDWSRAEALLPYVAPACWTKYFGLAIGALGASGICFFGARKRWIVGALGLVPLVAVTADWAGVVNIPTLLTLGLGGFWLALIVVGIIELWRAKGASP